MSSDVTYEIGDGSLLRLNQPIWSHFSGSKTLGVWPLLIFTKNVVGTQCCLSFSKISSVVCRVRIISILTPNSSLISLFIAYSLVSPKWT